MGYMIPDLEKELVILLMNRRRINRNEEPSHVSPSVGGNRDSDVPGTVAETAMLVHSNAVTSQYWRPVPRETDLSS